MNALKLIESVTEHFAAYGDVYEDSQKLLDIRLNISLITRYPHLFDGLFMTAPVDVIEDRVVEAKTRAFKMRYGFELSTATGSTFKDREVITVMADEAALEIEREIERLKAEGKTIISYIPLVSYRGVDPATFQPFIGFSTRYAVLEEGNPYVEDHAETPDPEGIPYGNGDGTDVRYIGTIELPN